MNSESAAPPEIVRLGEIELTFHAKGGVAPESVTAFAMTVPPGSFVPEPHAHRIADELVFGLAGTLTYWADGRRYLLGPGESAFCPRGKVHHFANEGSAPARALCVLTPGAIGIDYFREVAALVAAGGPPDPARMRAIMLRHGLLPASSAELSGN